MPSLFERLTKQEIAEHPAVLWTAEFLARAIVKQQAQQRASAVEEEGPQPHSYLRAPQSRKTPRRNVT